MEQTQSGNVSLSGYHRRAIYDVNWYVRHLLNLACSVQAYFEVCGKEDMKPLAVSFNLFRSQGPRALIATASGDDAIHIFEKVFTKTSLILFSLPRKDCS